MPQTALSACELPPTPKVEGAFPLLLSTFQIPIPALLFIPMKDEVVVHFKVVAIPE